MAVPDLRGHGRSDGPRGDLARLTDRVAELSAMTTGILLAGILGIALPFWVKVKWPEKVPVPKHLVDPTGATTACTNQIPSTFAVGAPRFAGGMPPLLEPLQANNRHPASSWPPANTRAQILMATINSQRRAPP